MGSSFHWPPGHNQEELFGDLNLLVHIIVCEERRHWIEVLPCEVKGFLHRHEVTMCSRKPAEVQRSDTFSRAHGQHSWKLCQTAQSARY